MKKTSTSKDSKRSIKILVFFCALVGILILGSLLLRFITVVLESKFDPDHRYTLAFIHKNKADVIALDPSTKVMSHMSLSGDLDTTKFSEETGILIDAEVILPDEFKGKESVSNYIKDALLHKNNVVTEMSSYDLGRLYIFSQKISTAEGESEEVILPLEPTSLDVLSKELFLDQAIADENITVSVVNGAGVQGLGKRLERALNNRGFNVISVENAEEVVSSTTIVYSGERKYSIKKLETIFGLRASASDEQKLSDIIVTLGKDQVGTTLF